MLQAEISSSAPAELRQSQFFANKEAHHLEFLKT